MKLADYNLAKPPDEPLVVYLYQFTFILRGDRFTMLLGNRSHSSQAWDEFQERKRRRGIDYRARQGSAPSP